MPEDAAQSNPHSSPQARRLSVQGGSVDKAGTTCACGATHSRQRGAKDFDLLLVEAAAHAPLGELADIMDVGFTCTYLATPFAKRVTGGTIYIDGGANIVA